jgi:excinuclease UvrABC nuclease subunit
MDSNSILEEYPSFSHWKNFTANEVHIMPTKSGVYLYRKKDGLKFGRLKGSSDILYIGKTRGKRGLRQRLYQYLNPGPTQWTNLRINSHMKENEIEFSYIVTENPDSLELELQRQYYNEHEELPPFNRSSGRLWKMEQTLEKINMKDSVESVIERGENSIYLKTSSKFVVQMNHRHKYSSIHRETCGFAKPPKHSTNNTTWFGPFDTYDEAKKKANLVYRADVRDCGYCKPTVRSSTKAGS